jgi:6-pyruvoyltetrahydropterin/6-carboxytetrahydropterin synthase
MFLITKQFKFDAAHNLLNYNGQCEKLHGHTYYLDVTFKGQKKNDGMVIDFSLIKKIINDEVLSELDHNYINDLIKISTAENIVEWIWMKIMKYDFKNEVSLFELKLWEGPHSFVTYRGGDNFDN